MQKIIKRYLCIVAILSTMMGYAQTTNGGPLNEVVVRANAADLAYRAWLNQIADGQAQMAMDEAVAKLKAEALARAEAIAIADAQAQGKSPASSTKKYGEKPMTKKQFDAYRQVLIDEKFGFKYKANYVVTTSDGKKHTGTIFILTDKKKGHDMHYFTPNSSDGRYTVGMYYRITNYESSSATTTGGSSSPGSTGTTTTTPFTYDSSGFPTGQAYYVNESGVSAGITILPNNSPVTVISIAQITHIWYADSDGDGYHSYTQEKEFCSHPWKSSTKGSDCDDNDAAKTTDCSGKLPMKGWFLDNDRDGYFAEVQTATTKPTKPGNWTDVMTKGPDCNDAVASADNSVCSVLIQGTNTDPGKDYVPKSTDKLVKAGIVTTCDKQSTLGVCVLTSLEVTLNNVLGLTVTSKEINTAAALSAGSLLVIQDGLTPAQAVTFINSFCNTEALTKSDFKTTIDAGKTFMTDIKTGTIITPDSAFPTDRSKDKTVILSHSVSVIGYDVDSNYIYIDPALGKAQIAPLADMGFSYSIIIKGKK